MDAAGKVVASTSNSEQLDSRHDATFSQQINLQGARALAVARTPQSIHLLATYPLRTADTTCIADKELGLASNSDPPVRSSAHRFLLNGEHVEIRGLCVHHDFPGVGVAAPDNLWEWRIAKLKSDGCANAYRCSHNLTSSEAFYRCCGRPDGHALVMDVKTRHLGDTYFPKKRMKPRLTPIFRDVKGMVLQYIATIRPSSSRWSMCNRRRPGA